MKRIKQVYVLQYRSGNIQSIWADKKSAQRHMDSENDTHYEKLSMATEKVHYRFQQRPYAPPSTKGKRKNEKTART